jgi:hypothetical protein
VKCAGPKSSRNDSGLALVLKRPGPDEPQRMLFPGDCAYNYIPPAQTGSFTALVCAHHGGHTHATFVPASDHNSEGRVVYSYGQSNSYGHPFAAVRTDHTNAGWQHALDTPNRCPPVFTGGAPNLLGHVHLYWDQAAPDEHPGCSGRACQLTCHQR